MKRLLIYFILLFLILNTSQIALAENEKIFRTRYTLVYYAEEKEINDFIWRLGGSKFEFLNDTLLASSRIDRIINRVEMILDMRPRNFKIDIYLHRGLLEGPNKVAFYEHKTKSIHISIENSSDGIFGHEIAHAVIYQYFASPPPSKVQEILTQYVDRYLWSD